MCYRLGGYDGDGVSWVPGDAPHRGGLCVRSHQRDAGAALPAALCCVEQEEEEEPDIAAG